MLPEKAEVIREWLKTSRQDLGVAQLIMTMKPVYEARWTEVDLC